MENKTVCKDIPSPSIGAGKAVVSGEPLSKKKEIDATVHNENNFFKTPGFLYSDVRSAVNLMKGHIGVVDESRRDLLVHTFKTKEVLDIIDFCFPVFKED